MEQDGVQEQTSTSRQLTFNKEEKAIQWEATVSSVTALDIRTPKLNLGPNSHRIETLTQNGTALNIKTKTVKLLGENIGENLVMTRRRFL